MLYINTKDNHLNTCSFYFGLEEYLMKDFSYDGDIFLLWNVRPTVMIGRHQITSYEIDQEYVSNNNIEVVRRNSGGGAVYTDMGCLQFSFITNTTNHSNIFDKHVSKIIHALASSGINASFTGRNDIVVDDKKISGNAEYIYKDRMVIHGTILFDSNLDHLYGSLTPDKSKLIKHAVKSTKSRVMNIRTVLDISHETFYDSIVNDIKTEEILLSNLDSAAITKYSEKFKTEQWNYGKNPSHEITKKATTNAGNFQVNVTIKNNIIKYKM